jgi:hypothetical protein
MTGEEGILDEQAMDCQFTVAQVSDRMETKGGGSMKAFEYLWTWWAGLKWLVKGKVELWWIKIKGGRI